MQLSSYYTAARKRIILALRGRYSVIGRKRKICYLFDAYNFVDRQIEAFGSYEDQQVTDLIAEVSSSNASVFIDIGANIGLYSLAIAKTFPFCEVLAFEPDRRNYCQLHANLFLNELEDRVYVEPVAVSSSPGTLKFRRHDSENRGRSQISETGDHQVEVVRLDDKVALRDAHIAIKIDVEGHEMHVVEGAIEVLRGNDCIVQIETFDPESLVTKMASLDYLLKKRTGDDLLFIKNI